MDKDKLLDVLLLTSIYQSVSLQFLAGEIDLQYTYDDIKNVIDTNTIDILYAVIIDTIEDDLYAKLGEDDSNIPTREELFNEIYDVLTKLKQL